MSIGGPGENSPSGSRYKTVLLPGGCFSRFRAWRHAGQLLRRARCPAPERGSCLIVREPRLLMVRCQPLMLPGRRWWPGKWAGDLGPVIQHSQAPLQLSGLWLGWEPSEVQEKEGIGNCGTRQPKRILEEQWWGKWRWAEGRARWSGHCMLGGLEMSTGLCPSTSTFCPCLSRCLDLVFCRRQGWNPGRQDMSADCGPAQRSLVYVKARETIWDTGAVVSASDWATLRVRKHRRCLWNFPSQTWCRGCSGSVWTALGTGVAGVGQCGTSMPPMIFTHWKAYSSSCWSHFLKQQTCLRKIRSSGKFPYFLRRR